MRGNMKLNWKLVLLVISLMIIISGIFGISLMAHARWAHFEGTPDGWLSYWGGIFGSGIGVIGALVVLREQINFEKVDNTFFNLLNMHNDVLNSIRNRNLKDKDVFDSIYSLMESNKKDEVSETKKNEEKRYIFDNKDDLIRTLTLVEKEISGLIDGYDETNGEYSKNILMDIRYGLSINSPTFRHAIDRENYEETRRFLDNIGKLFDNLKYSRIFDLSKDNFSLFYNLYSGLYNLDFPELSLKQKKKIIEISLEKHYGEIGNYFRIFHRVIKFINENVKDLDAKGNYIGFLRSMVNEKEMIVIFYNAFYSIRGAGLKEQLEFTDFFGKGKDLPLDSKLEAQHFNKKLLLWEKSDIDEMNTLKLQIGHPETKNS